VTEHQWKVQLLAERICEINGARWRDRTYGPPTREIGDLMKDAIRFVEADELNRCECLLDRVEVAIVRRRRAVRPWR
jgi:hypothetical protein